jgi:hypothetical protein
MNQPLASMSVGVVVERRKAQSMWLDFVWRPAAILAGLPDTPPWTLLSEQDGVATYFAGSAEVELYRTETGNYRDNLFGDGVLWVVLQPSAGERPYELLKVTADPAEGEAFNETGSCIVETLPMPAVVQEFVAAFVAEHHVEQRFTKRQRDQANPEALARRDGAVKGGGE